jgi:hypothetical protein
MEDEEAIQQMLKIPESEWQKVGPPPLFGWSRIMERLTDLGDQLIASRASNPKSVQFFPRPKIPAIVRRKRHVGGEEG